MYLHTFPLTFKSGSAALRCPASRIAFLVITTLLSSGPGSAHEFWIEPVQYHSNQPFEITASIRVGENFKGSELAYVPDRFVRFFIHSISGNRDVNGRLGDMPALLHVAADEGSNIIVYQSKDNYLVHPTFDEFKSFAEKENIEWIIDKHVEKGLPEINITESFSRYAKSLVGSGPVFDDDMSFGMPLEIVYQGDSTLTLSPGQRSFKLLYQNKPMPNHQITVFHKDNENLVSTKLYKTNNSGIAIISARESGSYLLNAVVARTPTPKKMLNTGTLWETLWASLTFGNNTTSLPVRRKGTEVVNSATATLPAVAFRDE